MTTRDLTFQLTLTDPTLESVSKLMGELRGREGVVSASILELEEKDHSFEKDLERIINRHSRESGSDTPDFILAEYLKDCLKTFDRAVKQRTDWYKRDDGPEIDRVMPHSQNPAIKRAMADAEELQRARTSGPLNIGHGRGRGS